MKSKVSKIIKAYRLKAVKELYEKHTQGFSDREKLTTLNNWISFLENRKEFELAAFLIEEEKKIKVNLPIKKNFLIELFKTIKKIFKNKKGN